MSPFASQKLSQAPGDTLSTLALGNGEPPISCSFCSQVNGNGYEQVLRKAVNDTKQGASRT